MTPSRNWKLGRDTLLGLLALAANGCLLCAQQPASFDPLVRGACEQQLGHGPEDDSVPAARGFDVQCGDLDARREESEFAHLLADTAKAGKPQQDAYAQLLSAFKSYRQLYMEIDRKECGGGVGCSSQLELDQAHIDYEFLILAEGVHAAALPSASPEESRKADSELNARYQQILAAHPLECAAPGSDGFDEGCISQAGLRTAQRAWIRYRDLFLSYAAIRWPASSRDSWIAYLETQRTNDNW